MASTRGRALVFNSPRTWLAREAIWFHHQCSPTIYNGTYHFKNSKVGRQVDHKPFTRIAQSSVSQLQRSYTISSVSPSLSPIALGSSCSLSESESTLWWRFVGTRATSKLPSESEFAVSRCRFLLPESGTGVGGTLLRRSARILTDVGLISVLAMSRVVNWMECVSSKINTELRVYLCSVLGIVVVVLTCTVIVTHSESTQFGLLEVFSFGDELTLSLGLFLSQYCQSPSR